MDKIRALGIKRLKTYIPTKYQVRQFVLGIKRLKTYVPTKYQVRRFVFGVIVILILAVLMGME